MTKWVKCSERLPDKVGMYLVYRSGRGQASIRCQSFHAFDIYSKNLEHHRLRFWNTGGAEDKYVTHYMPLPEAPKDA